MVANVENLSNVDVKKIPSTVDFPSDVIKKHLPEQRGEIWDMGHGGGEKLRELAEMGFTPWGFDVNKRAVESVNSDRQHDIFASVADLREFGSGETDFFTITWLENVCAQLYQAVFPSLLGDDWKNALWAGDMMMKPHGLMFVADFVSGEKLRSDLFQNNGPLTEGVWKESARRWGNRYAANQAAFDDIELPDRAFAVGKVGPTKMDYDWSDNPKSLRAQYDLHLLGRASLFERFATHLDMEEFEEFVGIELGYELLEKRMVSRRSRSTTNETKWSVAPGAWWVFRKSNTYKYHPWKLELDPDDDGCWDAWKARKGNPNRNDFFEDYYTTLAKNIPDSQMKIFREMASRVGVSI